MNLETYVARLREDLTAAAALGDEQTRTIASALAVATAPAARLLLLSALTDFANEVSEQLGDRTLGIRLDGDEVIADLHRSSSTSDPDNATEKDTRTRPSDVNATFDDVTGDISRVTLRLMDQIKSKAEEAASQNGVSLNSWVSQAVQGALRDHIKRNGTNDF